MIINSKDAEKRAVLAVADKMMAAARTAPKGCGLDNIETAVLTDKDKDQLTAAMRKIAEETGAEFFNRDAENIDSCHAVVIIGAVNNPVGLENCSLCGFPSCGDTANAGANCAFNITDLGIAIGSAVSISADNRIDSRVMFSAGKAVVKLSLLGKDVRVAYGIPLSTTSKSIFFDRGTPSAALAAK